MTHMHMCTDTDLCGKAYDHVMTMIHGLVLNAALSRCKYTKTQKQAQTPRQANSISNQVCNESMCGRINSTHTGETQSCGPFSKADPLVGLWSCGVFPLLCLRLFTYRAYTHSDICTIKPGHTHMHTHRNR